MKKDKKKKYKKRNWKQYEEENNINYHINLKHKKEKATNQEDGNDTDKENPITKIVYLKELDKEDPDDKLKELNENNNKSIGIKKDDNNDEKYINNSIKDKEEKWKDTV